ncbi:Putative basic-leucine zipper domain-containing protein [Septoria linicola]|uniref:Putative transcription factor kapC n=1 Tax=Septoria linicola TaxID=215465 RepID=A0A9Q9AZP4_9PEZI|nr:Putative basic-leucine zipper domain-containing protein [Septoria linicola]
MQRAQEMNSEISLREQLLAETANSSAPPPYPSATASNQGPSNPYPQSDHTGSPHEHHQIDPNAAGGQLQYSMSGDGHLSGGEGSGKGKRELSTSKRAAQNRAAQRAFRQRKEGYIKKLEEQVKDFQSMEHNYKALQNENYQLREYILSLQSKLLENQSEIPPAPTHANLSSAAPSQSYASRVAETYALAEQQERRDSEQRAPPPAPVIAHEDQRHDGIAQLHQAAVAQEGRQQASPYGLGSEYPSRQPETTGVSNSKPSS